MDLVKPTPSLAGERRLTAVMFTDVANFSGLSETDEEQTLVSLRRDFEIMFDLLARHKGKLLKTLGDGLLCHFQSAVHAVKCAQDIQRVLAAAPVQSGAVALKHRIGIHVGDVFVTETDIAGNGVNIAARLQSRALPGGVCISQTVFDLVKHQVELRVNYLGPQELKNIRDSVPAYQLLSLGSPPAPPTASVPGRNPVSAGVAAASPGLRFQFGQTPPVPVRRNANSPGSIVILGDFSGRASRGIVEPVGSRVPLRVDFDNFESVFGQLGVRLSLPQWEGHGEMLELRFGGPADLHPDSLLRDVPRLAQLLALRRNFGNAPSASHRPGRAGVGRDSPVIEPALAALDGELTSQLRAILHHPDFQALEAAWQGIALLVRDFGTETNLHLHLLDVSRDELAADLASSEEVQDSGMARLLAANPFALCLANYSFGQAVEDLQLLSRVGRLAAAGGSPILAAGRPELVGCESFGREPNPEQWQIAFAPDARAIWDKLRRSAEAAHLGLAMPRVLMRQPYGAHSDPIESFPFEELPASLPHESYLWGNPAFACAHILARGIARPATDLIPRGGQLGRLPLHRFMEDGEPAVKPDAEAWLTDRAATAIERRGIIPLRSVKGLNAVIVPHFQSLAEPAKPLALRVTRL